jgi:hypothetical protein
MKRKPGSEYSEDGIKKTASFDQVVDGLCALRVEEEGHRADVYDNMIRSLRDSINCVEGDPPPTTASDEASKRGFQLFIRSSVLLTYPTLARSRDEARSSAEH